MAMTLENQLDVEREIKDIESSLKENGRVLLEDFYLMADAIDRHKRDKERLKLMMSDVINQANNGECSNQVVIDTTSFNTECNRCLELQNQMDDMMQEIEKLEYMKPYTEELLTQQDILRARARELESKLKVAQIEKRDLDNKEKWYFSTIDILKDDVKAAYTQMNNTERSLHDLHLKVQEVRMKSAELEMINKHQQCLLKESYETITLLKAELGKSS